MRKYMEIARVYLKTQLAWRSDTVFQILFALSKIIFAYLLWGVIFDGKSEVAGFTFDGMLSYYIFSSFLTQIEMSERISTMVSTGIRNGTFSKYMVIPVNTKSYFLAMEAGCVVFYLGFDILTAALWIFLFRINLVFTGSWLTIGGAVVMILLGLLFMAQLNYLLGILTLKFQEISTFLMIKDNLMALVTGSIVPLVLFPEKIVAVMRLLPFYYVTYLPAMLLTGKCSDELAGGLAVLGFWCIALECAIGKTWSACRRTYEGVGI